TRQSTSVWPWLSPSSRSMASISPTTTPLRSGASGMTDATSMPALTRRSAACSAVSRRSTSSRPQPYGSFLVSRESPEEAQVVLEEEAQIVDAVLQHRDALDAHPERPARVVLRIVADVLQHLRVHHPAAEDLEPAGLLAHTATVAVTGEAQHVHLGRGLRERKEGRPEADPRARPEHLAREELERPLEVGHRDAAVDRQPFDLVEHRGVRHVDDVAAIDLARHDDAHRRLLRQHRADLYRRGVGPQEGAVREVERVLHVPGGMVARDVERLEVVVVALDLGSLGDREAEPGEDRDDLVAHAGQRVERPLRGPPPRQGEIEPPAAALGLALRRRRGRQPRVEQPLELALGLVGGGADERALLGRQGAERSQELCQRALPAEHADADGFELARRLRRGDGRPRLVHDGVDARVRHELPALGFSGLGELRERRRIGDRQLRQHLAIEVDAGLLEGGHELRVREPHLAARSVDAYDPERARLALLLLSAPVGGGPRAQNRLGRRLVELAPPTEVALRLLEDLLAPSARLRSTLCPWHSAAPLLWPIDTGRARSGAARPPCRSACPCAACGG